MQKYFQQRAILILIESPHHRTNYYKIVNHKHITYPKTIWFYAHQIFNNLPTRNHDAALSTHAY